MAKKQTTVPISERALEKELNKSDFLFGPYIIEHIIRGAEYIMLC